MGAFYEWLVRRPPAPVASPDVGGPVLVVAEVRAVWWWLAAAR
jgi:hypothetical protein